MYRFGTRLSLCVLVGGLTLGSIQTASADPSEGLIAHWLLDGDATDLVGTNDGTLFGDTSFHGGAGIAPIYGNQDAVDFLGNGDDYIEVPDDPALDLSGSFTVAAWANVDGTNGGNPIVSKEFASTSESNYNLQMLFTRAQLFFQFDAAASPNVPTLGTSVCSGSNSCGVRTVFDVVSLDTWHHIAGVYDNSTKTVTVYVDGVKQGEGSFNTSGSPQPNIETVQIGRRKATQFAGPGLAGQIDDVRIYERALSDDEIFDLYKSTIKVAVDILPGDPINSIDLDLVGTIPVAILSSPEFDAADLVDGVNPNAFSVGSPRLGLLADCDPFTFDNIMDVNGDGLDDVVCSADISQDPDLIAESPTFVQAETVSGFPIEGADVLRVIGLKEPADNDDDGIPNSDEAPGCVKNPEC